MPDPTQMSDREDSVHVLRFAHASSLRAHADELRAEGAVDYRNMEPDDDLLKKLDAARKTSKDADATLMELQATFIEKYGVKALEELL